MSKAQYRIRNWKNYNKSLVKRGSITVWFSEDAVNKWDALPAAKRGRPSTYSDDAILTALLIRFVFHLPLPWKAFFPQLCQLWDYVFVLQAIVRFVVVQDGLART